MDLPARTIGIVGRVGNVCHSCKGGVPYGITKADIMQGLGTTTSQFNANLINMSLCVGYLTLQENSNPCRP